MTVFVDDDQRARERIVLDELAALIECDVKLTTIAAVIATPAASGRSYLFTDLAPDADLNTVCPQRVLVALLGLIARFVERLPKNGHGHLDVETFENLKQMLAGVVLCDGRHEARN